LPRLKAKVFVGSSVESLESANAIQANLEHKFDVTVWQQGIFSIGGYPLDDLLTALQDFDFGVFVFSPDDSVTSRKRTQPAVRDNVIFELGLFIGRLGRTRSFVVAPKDEKNLNLRLPSDLSGWGIVRYDGKNKNLQSALGSACSQIATKIKNENLKRKPNPTQKALNKTLNPTQKALNKTLNYLNRKIDELALKTNTEHLAVVRNIDVPHKKALAHSKFSFGQVPKKPVKPVGRSKASTGKAIRRNTASTKGRKER
jgi:hypothetical protein